MKKNQTIYAELIMYVMMCHAQDDDLLVMLNWFQFQHVRKIG